MAGERIVSQRRRSPLINLRRRQHQNSVIFTVHYRKTLHDLTDRIRQEDFAGELGVSVSEVRQTALPRSSALARPAPPGWQKAAEKLASQKAKHFQKLADALAKSDDARP